MHDAGRSTSVVLRADDHGAFRVRAGARGVALVAYGIGITPSMSILRTAADLSRWDFFLCGAAAPVASGIAAFAENGIAPERVHAERFVEV